MQRLTSGLRPVQLCNEAPRATGPTGMHDCDARERCRGALGSAPPPVRSRASGGFGLPVTFPSPSALVAPPTDRPRVSVRDAGGERNTTDPPTPVHSDFIPPWRCCSARCGAPYSRARRPRGAAARRRSSTTAPCRWARSTPSPPTC
jgi:hypothetical protein